MDDTEKRHEAAVKIQRRWRAYIDIQVFKYYKSLINFRNQGHPALILRCINPREAGLIDAASGIKVRFRLAGPEFPPCIYYKIYTVRNIVDVCACSPKNYCHNSNKKKTANYINNKIGNNQEVCDGQTKWYNRTENNGWRLVSDRLLHNYGKNQQTWETQKTIIFHPSKLKRRQDVQKQRKARKIEWMKKMYEDGLLQSKIKESQYEELVNEAVTGIINTTNQYGLDKLSSWEVDELLDWTVSLNYDDYVNEWKQIGTTKNSQNILDNLFYSMSTTDPFELTLSSDPTSNH
ncbi:Uncharacterized protein C11orf65 homolog,Uncharacterized protein C11orf65 [Acanthosepion pharaonis]|uniref:Uncharacterized protein C11orf65 homolog,Uncharacterized protein C11orf65 n=1 Tax=Acanthosepion pharaonis TaxID=158019 RepID=A0A812B7M0_ACAPH|nr:Uncharacterized protein C11orf65 homolog,Uncharacterized protein C11orf65 [Sepia pharaonis]